MGQFLPSAFRVGSVGIKFVAVAVSLKNNTYFYWRNGVPLRWGKGFDKMKNEKVRHRNGTARGGSGRGLQLIELNENANAVKAVNAHLTLWFR
jgi:hypothetical protein